MAPLHGSWSLESFEIEKPDGPKKPWGKSMSGLLIYSPDGHMSVSINRQPTSEGSSDVLDSVLFYSGFYAVKGDKIFHHVENATSLNRIGKEMVRFYKLDGELLYLWTKEEDFGTARLTWKKIK